MFVLTSFFSTRKQSVPGKFARGYNFSHIPVRRTRIQNLDFFMWDYKF